MLTQELVRDLFDLDEASGKLYWKLQPNNSVFAGSEAGCLDKSSGRIRVGINYKEYARSRVVFLYVNGYLPKQVDHIDPDQVNDCPSNLRPATHQHNRWNRRGWSKTGLPKGVSRSVAKANPFRAYIKHNSHTCFLGYFQTEEAAHQAYVRAAKAIHGEFLCPK
jgi:hypothetical protein